ncbi:MAG: hypothetical protein ABSC93_23850 [Bryobacteraceae bacterium]|jgi:hypothetical protein
MDHSEAASGQAVERYLLGEMAEPEAEAFEQHFFECTLCTEELASGALLVENLRATPAPEAGRQAAARPVKSQNAFGQWWRRPLFAAPAFATIALACTVAYQARELARLNQPQALLAYTLKSASRGEGNRIPLQPGASRFAIGMDLPDATFPAYRCSVYDSSGNARFSVETPAPGAGVPLNILVPERDLAPGSYTLKVFGLRGSLAGPEIAHYSFDAFVQPQ